MMSLGIGRADPRPWIQAAYLLADAAQTAARETSCPPRPRSPLNSAHPGRRDHPRRGLQVEPVFAVPITACARHMVVGSSGSGKTIPLIDESGEVVDQGLALIPRGGLDLEETWFVAGMKSTGSNCLIATDVFGPSHRIVSVPPAIEGHYATEFSDEAFYRSAFVPILALVLAGPQLGLGRAALDIVREKAAKKPISCTSYTAQADSVAFQLQLAEAAMLIDTAHLHAYRAAGDIDRDSSVAARHAVVLPVIGYEVYGKALLGREDHITPLV
jgi:Acyl-CoA dehydrogenase, C-terminal domain